MTSDLDVWRSTKTIDESRGSHATRCSLRILVVSVVVGLLAVVARVHSARADAESDTLAAAQAADARHDYATELKLLRPLAEEGNRRAQTSLGLMYAYGKGVPKDYKNAVAWYGKAAEQGNARAQTLLGIMYEFGNGVPQDYTQAAGWYRKAAEQGFAPAQARLGIMYNLGNGVPKDYKEALGWYRKAAEQGNARAQTLLGIMYEFGNGVPKDYVQAYMWFNLAAAGGNNEAAKFRDSLEKSMTPGQIAEAQRRTAAWKPTRSGTQ
jgi:TPR repeat protein